MACQDEPKKYGLILPKKDRQPTKALPVLKKASIFDDDNDEDGEFKPRTADAKAQYGNKSLWKKETQLTIQKALEEDPTAFEYDQVFDKMVQTKAENENRTQDREAEKERKPKYVHSLIAAAKEREREFDRRLERKVQRERETEGGEFADKEAFVTSSYKKKMEEMRQQEAKEKEMARIEGLLDVTKQKDLSGFYRHLLKQSTGEERVRNAGETATPPTPIVARPVENLPGSSRKQREDSPEEILPVKKQRLEESPEPVDEMESDVDNNAEPIEVLPEKLPVPEIVVNAERKDAFAKHSTEDSAKSARERYLARQAAKAKQT